MTKRQFRLQTFGESTPSVDRVILTAAKSNGDNPISLKQLANLGKGWAEMHDHPKSETQFELIGDHTLRIDAKGRDERETLAVIEEVEVYEPESVIEEDRVF